MQKLLILIILFSSINAQYLDKYDRPLLAKKQKFLKTILPPLNQVYDELMFVYNEVKYYMDRDMQSYQIDNLKEEYHIQDNQKLLIAIYPHPKSITLAQSAMESNWATSRIFKSANNIFGIWSYDKNEPRIPALEKRGDKTIYLKKYDNIKDSIKDYYRKMSLGKNFAKFRKDSFNHKSPIVLANDLKMYSETREEYSKQLISIIKYNRLEEFDKR
jgi:Bax protein